MLVVAGTVALSYSLPIAVAIAVLIAIVISSYRQTILAYPKGGGAYIVSKDNLGTMPGLIAARRAADRLRPHGGGQHRRQHRGADLGGARAVRLPHLALRARRHRRRGREPARHSRVGQDLRGPHLPVHRQPVRAGGLRQPGGHLRLRRRGAVSAAPVRARGRRVVPDPPGLRGRLRRAHRGRGGLRRRPRVQAPRSPQRAGRAELARCHPDHAVPGYHVSGLRLRHPAPRGRDGRVAAAPGTCWGRASRTTRSSSSPCSILLLAANTSFADFPRLAFFLARDRFIPRQFGTQGDRLVFSNGIVILGGLAAALLVVFGGDTQRADPALRGGRFHLLHAVADRAWCAAGSACAARAGGGGWR